MSFDRECMQGEASHLGPNRCIEPDATGGERRTQCE